MINLHARIASLAIAGAAALATTVAVADGGRGAVVKDGVNEAPYSWTGVYGGMNVGSAWLNDSGWTGTPADAATAALFAACGPAGACPLNRPSGTGNGVIGGLQIGYNLQMQNFLIGVEADLQGSTANASRSISTNPAGGFVPGTHNANTSLEWLGTIRGRLGVVVNPALLAYVTGGWAFSEVQRSGGAFANDNTTRYAGQSSANNSGWTAGGGFEWAFAPRVTVGAEYLYVALDGDRFVSSFSPGPANVCTAANCNANVRAGDLDVHIARLKVNYRF